VPLQFTITTLIANRLPESANFSTAATFSLEGVPGSSMGGTAPSAPPPLWRRPWSQDTYPITVPYWPQCASFTTPFCGYNARSSAVAERPRDVSWLSLVCFNSTVPRVHSLVTLASDLSLRTIKCCSVVFGVTLRLLVIHTSSLSAAINKLRRLLLPAMSVTNFLQSGGTVLITTDGRSIDNPRCSEILVEDSDFFYIPVSHLLSTPPWGGFRQSIAMTFGMEKLVCTYGYSKWKKYVYSFRQSTRTWQTDKRTDRHRTTA